ncbi:hypothetical protein V8E51_002479 [Hyaloscypha variabilis]
MSAATTGASIPEVPAAGVTVSNYVGASNPTTTGGEGGTGTGLPITTVPASTSSSTSSSAPISTPASPTKVAVYEWFYFTLTWEYITWSVIYSPETMLSTTYVESVFTAIITTSVVSIYATNSAAASASFSSLSATFSTSTPAAPTSPFLSPTTASSPSFTAFTAIPTVPFTTLTATGTAGGGSGGTVNDALSLKLRRGAGIWVCLIAVVGGLMVWL